MSRRTVNQSTKSTDRGYGTPAHAANPGFRAPQARERRRRGRRRLWAGRLDRDHGTRVPQVEVRRRGLPRAVDLLRPQARGRGWCRRPGDVRGGARDRAAGDGYDLVAIFDALHDMDDPIGAASAAHRALAPQGTLMVVEPFAHDHLADNLNSVGRVYYGASTLVCTPCALADDGLPSAPERAHSDCSRSSTPPASVRTGAGQLRGVLSRSLTDFRIDVPEDASMRISTRPSTRPSPARGARRADRLPAHRAGVAGAPSPHARLGCQSDQFLPRQEGSGPAGRGCRSGQSSPRCRSDCAGDPSDGLRATGCGGLAMLCCGVPGSLVGAESAFRPGGCDARP
jgi:hypothetical protein